MREWFNTWDDVWNNNNEYWYWDDEFGKQMRWNLISACPDCTGCLVFVRLWMKRQKSIFGPDNLKVYVIGASSGFVGGSGLTAKDLVPISKWVIGQNDVQGSLR